MSGQVDRAIETGRMLLARLGPPSPRAAHLHLGIARAAMAGARWAEAAASIEVARESRRGRSRRGRRLRGAGRRGPGPPGGGGAAGPGRAARGRGPPRRPGSPRGPAEVACEALEVIGRVARQRDLEAAERAFARAADLAGAHGLPLWRLRALHELGTIDQLRTESVDRLEQARELAVAQGALALTATLDLQIAAGLNKQFRADEALAAARRSADASRRFRLATLPMALIFQATAHADPRRGRPDGGPDRRGGRARSRRPGRARLRLGALPGHVQPAGRRPRRGPRADDDRGRAAAQFPGDDRAAVPGTVAAARRGARPRRGSGRGPGPRRPRPPAPGVAALLGYADAIRAGQQGHPGDAEDRVRRRRPPDGAAGGLVPAVRAPPDGGGGAGRRLGRAGRVAAGGGRLFRRPRRRTGGRFLPRAAAPGRGDRCRGTGPATARCPDRCAPSA